jgi:hypothetical protein
VNGAAGSERTSNGGVEGYHDHFRAD